MIHNNKLELCKLHRLNHLILNAFSQVNVSLDKTRNDVYKNNILFCVERKNHLQQKIIIP